MQKVNDGIMKIFCI